MRGAVSEAHRQNQIERPPAKLFVASFSRELYCIHDETAKLFQLRGREREGFLKGADVERSDALISLRTGDDYRA